ncbi:DMT family transporter [Neptuniibacter sp.]|uniref:DMT family transporter n=1 Tax=Neptuniibacter sp. TaxID=1962643 RepID=UPI002605A316|nr:DMT family transporter [Neptuniibacter sp.]MCP4597844.1 DMT family transporter [Neptuniibacter sp.]
MPANPIYQGALLIVLSELFLVVSGMVVKQVTGELPTEIIVFARNLFGLFLLLPWLLRNGFEAIKTDHLRFHVMRATVGVTAMMCLYYSWGHLPLAEAALIKQTAPFFIPIFAFLWLGERVSLSVKLAILVGFSGVVLVLNPGSGTLKTAVLIALFGAMLGALAKVIIRRMSSTESPQRVVFYFALISSCLSLVPALLVWVMPTLEQMLWLLLMAITSTVAQLLLSKGYGLAPAGQLGPYTYASVAFAALFGWWLWDEVLGLNSWLGVGLIFGAGLLSLSSKKAKESTK